MHVELLAPMIEAALREAGVDRTELDGVVVGTGPGPFTGLRVGIVTARALALALDIPVYGVPSLDALAWHAVHDQSDGVQVLVATDARRKEVYSALYHRDSRDVVRDGDFVVGQARDVEVPDGARLVGHGVALYPEALGAAPTEDLPLYPAAAILTYLAAVRTAAGQDLTAGDALEPHYLRRPDVHAPGPRKRAS